MTVLERDFPLTTKWAPRIKGFSFLQHAPFQFCLQESLILEWELRKKEFSSSKHKENYFLKSLGTRLVGSVMSEIKNADRLKEHTDKYKSNVPVWRNHFVNHSSLARDTESSSSGDIFDQFIYCRSFDELYYEELVNHVAEILLGIDSISAQMFLYRLKLDKHWKAIRQEYFPMIPHNDYYRKIKMIKRVVKTEVCLG